MAYTYHLYWKAEELHYYGVRYAKNCSPEDLWVTYFTSSNLVKKARKLHGEPTLIEVRKIFNNTDDARNWESHVLKKLNVINKENWLNQTDNKSISIEACRRGITTRTSRNYTHSKETKDKIRLSRIGVSQVIPKWSEDRKKKMSEFWLGKRKPWLENKPSGALGKHWNRSKESNKKISDSRKQLPKEVKDKFILNIGV